MRKNHSFLIAAALCGLLGSVLAAESPAVPAASEPTTRPRIEITAPADESTVGKVVVVKGIIKGLDRLPDKQELVAAVHPVQVNSIWVQNKPLAPTKSDNRLAWRATVYCGTDTEGKGQDYEILVFVYKAGGLNPGDQIDKVPEGAQLVASILVKRARD